MQSAIINFTTEEKTKQEAQKVAKQMGISLSRVLNSYLKHFVSTKTVVFTAEEEIPNKRTARLLKKSEEEVKAGKVIRFEGPKDALAYLDRMIEREKNKN